jgi:TonB family protein
LPDFRLLRSVKRVIYLLVSLLPLFVSAGLPIKVVERRYIEVLAKSFTDSKLIAPRSPLYWSLCLGETTALSPQELSKRIASLAEDSVARATFYKRLNFYRNYSNPNDKSVPIKYESIFLPRERRYNEEPDVKLDDLVGFNQYIAGFGDDPDLIALWNSCDGGGPDGPESKVLTVCDSFPEFPGGDAELKRFILHQIEWPESERDNSITAKVIVRFVVCPDGHVSQATVIRGVSPGFDLESILLVKMLPPFNPGKQGGRNVAVYYSLPIVFKLQ